MADLTDVSVLDSDGQRLVSVLQRHHLGPARAVEGRQLIRMMGFRSRVKLRQVVRDLRRQGFPICSDTERGYWWPAEPDDIDRTIADLTARSTDMLETARRLESARSRLFGPQRKLF